MGLKALQKIADFGEKAGAAPRKILELVPGNRLKEFEALHNVRLVYDGPYLHIVRRGGSTSQLSLSYTAITLFPFSARVNNVLKDYLAIHDANGDITLWNITDNTSSVIMTGFPTTSQIQLTHNGIFLFAFSYDAGVAKYYDMEKTAAYSFLNYNRPYIQNINLLTGDLSDDNLWGFKKGQDIIVWPNATWTAGIEILSSANGSGHLDYTQYEVNSFRYVYNGGKYLVDQNGVSYQSTRFFTFAPGDPTLIYTVGGSGTDFTIEKFYIPLDENGNPAFVSYKSKIESITSTFINFRDSTGVKISAKFGDPNNTEDLTDRNIVFPYTGDLDDLIGQPANKQLNPDGNAVQANDDYTIPAMYRAYKVIDILNDGSSTIAGRPYQLKIDANSLYQDADIEAKFTVSAPAANVAKRYLCATRWQSSAKNAFDPSQPNYPNSPYFIIGEKDINIIYINDHTTDDQLLRPIIEENVDMAGGIPNMFGPGELLPDSVARFRGSLLFGGYQVSRPIPQPYTNPSSATKENIYIDIQPTTQLANNMALAFQFEYTDGKRSNIVETNQYLQKGSSVQTQPVACNQVKSSASNTVQNGCQVNGQVKITYQGIDVFASLDTTNQATAANVAEAIRAAIVANANILITATVPSGAQLNYTEKRYGNFDGNQISISNVPVAATASIKVNANNIAASGSETHTITVGANTTGNITINDTDTVSGIADKYVSAINGDATINANWTASKIDNGDGTFTVLLTNNTPGSAGNGTAISVGGVTSVSLTITSPSAGGTDGPGITFDTNPVSLAGSQIPQGTAAQAFIRCSQNAIQSGGSNDIVYVDIDGYTSPGIVVNPGDSIATINGNIFNTLKNDATITANYTITYGTVAGGSTQWIVITSNYPGDTSYNGKSVQVNSTKNLGLSFDASAPGTSVTSGPVVIVLTAGANAGCIQAVASIDVTANSLSGGASENHTITVDGNATAAITIADTDTLSGIVDKYIAAIQNTAAINIDWNPTKVDNGNGTFSLILTFREYGSVGNSRSVSVSGNTSVSLTVNSPSAGGTDAGTVAVGTASEVNANRLQIHSLNTLVSKIYILGRENSGTKTFYLIKEVQISDPEAQGMIIDLPNTATQLTDIEQNVFTQVSSTGIREIVHFQNYWVVGTPFQEFSISDQASIYDEARILRIMPLRLDVDKTQMRYRFLIITDKNLQLAYLTERGSGYQKDIEITYEGIQIKDGSRAGITLIEDERVVLHTEDGIKIFDHNKVVKLIDNLEYDLIQNNTLLTAVLNRTQNEYWFIFDDQSMLAYDIEAKAVKYFTYDGPGISANLAHCVYGHNNMILAIGTEICYTDLLNVNDDLGQGASNSYYIQGSLITTHLGTPKLQTKILEVDIEGQTYNVQLSLDLQKSRRESVTTPWTKNFTSDITTTQQVLNMGGVSFEFHKRAIMPKIKIVLNGAGQGFVSHVILKYLEFENRGKARI